MAVSEVLYGLAELPAHPEAAPVFARMRDARVQVVALTKGSERKTLPPLKSAGLLDAVDRVVSVDEARHWKPRPEVYQYTTTVAGVEPV